MPASLDCIDRIPLEVRVRAFALPERSPLMNTGVASAVRLPEWLRRADVDAELRRNFRLHYQTLDPLPSPVVRVSADGGVTVDSSEWEKAVAELFESGRSSHVFLPVWSTVKSGEMQGIYFLWHYPAVTRQRWFGARVCEEGGELHPDFQARFGAYVRHMHRVLVKRGWLDRCFISTMDEPYTYHTGERALDTPENNYRVIRNFVEWVRREAPGIKTFATADPHPELEGWVDHWCLRNLVHAEAARRRSADFGETVTFCDNYRTFVDYPAVAPRSLGWLAWKIGARGWLTFETLADLGDSAGGPVFVYPQFGGGTVWGMGRLFSVDAAGRGGLAPSLRWELMREGAEDYQYLWLLRECVKQAEVLGGRAEWLRAARGILDSASREVAGGGGDAETTPNQDGRNAQSNSVPHGLRAQIADLIESFAK
jgi:hypothetical protein